MIFEGLFTVEIAPWDSRKCQRCPSVGIMESRITKRRGNEIARHACADSKNVGMIEGQTVGQPVDADRVWWIHAQSTK